MKKIKVSPPIISTCHTRMHIGQRFLPTLWLNSDMNSGLDRFNAALGRVTMWGGIWPSRIWSNPWQVNMACITAKSKVSPFAIMMYEPRAHHRRCSRDYPVWGRSPQMSGPRILAKWCACCLLSEWQKFCKWNDGIWHFTYRANGAVILSRRLSDCNYLNDTGNFILWRRAFFISSYKWVLTIWWSWARGANCSEDA